MRVYLEPPVGDGLEEEGHGSLGLSEEGLQVLVGGFAPEVPVFVAEGCGLGDGGDFWEELIEGSVNLVFPASEVVDTELLSRANIVDGEALRV